MKHFKFDLLDSTQTCLKNLLLQEKNEENILVTTISQKRGIGRKGSTWTQEAGSLAFSFTYKPAHLGLASLEVALSIVLSLEKKLESPLLLKWPNDLYYHEKKCGGIIAQMEGEKIMVGVGLNYAGVSPSCDQPTSSLVPQSRLLEKDYHEIPRKLFEDLLLLKVSQKELFREWERRCIHLKKNVIIENEFQKTEGCFQGISEQGEAIVQTTKGEVKLFTGQLRFV